MTRHGGWPLTVFLTPDRVPFYGGTYFPPEDRHGMPGFPRILAGVADAYRTQPDEVRQSAWEILSRAAPDERRAGVDRDASTRSCSTTPTAALARSVRLAARRLRRRAEIPRRDEPRLPAAHVTSAPATRDALEMVTHTCRQMADGGMYDQLGGGFHRYSIDARWLVPHFEKMLYDNALLARLYLHAYPGDGRRVLPPRRRGDARLRRARDDGRVGRRSTRRRTPTPKATRASSSSGTRRRSRACSAPEDARLFCAYYDVTEGGQLRGAQHPQHPAARRRGRARTERHARASGRGGRARARHSLRRRASGASSPGATRRSSRRGTG